MLLNKKQVIILDFGGNVMFGKKQQSLVKLAKKQTMNIDKIIEQTAKKYWKNI